MKKISGNGLLRKMLICLLITNILSVAFLSISYGRIGNAIDVGIGIFVGTFYGFIPAMVIAFVWEYFSTKK